MPATVGRRRSTIKQEHQHQQHPSNVGGSGVKRKSFRSTAGRKKSLSARCFLTGMVCFGFLLMLYPLLVVYQHGNASNIDGETTHSILEKFSQQSEISNGSSGSNSSSSGRDINSHHSRFGSVMKELACRVLSRRVTSSNILVVSPGAVPMAQQLSVSKHKTILTTPLPPSVFGAKFIEYGVKEGHYIHAMESSTYSFLSDTNTNTTDLQQPTLDAWWKSLATNDTTSKGIWWWTSAQPIRQPKWILLAVFDSAIGFEDVVWKEAQSFLEESTVTYIVLVIRSRKINKYKYDFGGLQAVEKLLQRKYKLQTLGASHYQTTQNHERETLEKYGPNALFRSVNEVRGFLAWGANVAAASANKNNDDDDDNIFTGYIFATQGLDLAIPTPQVYLREDSKKAINVFDKDDMKDLPPLKSCPDDSNQLEVSLDDFVNETTLILKLPDNRTLRLLQDQIEKHSDEFSVWMSAESLYKSEAVCVRHREGMSRCRTRIPKKHSFGIPYSDMNYSKRPNIKRPNILLILLDPISRPHFHRSMPQTKATLEALNFIEFEKYTAIGPNSGPNQAALYSGTTLRDRSKIQNLDHGNEWLWDRLRANGYITLKGEDSCIENSNMMQSLAPNTTHGSALHGMFCFDAFSRPNCLGPDLASSLLMEYGEQFLNEYVRIEYDNPLRWASFLHFVDSHEDTMMLSSVIDRSLSDFLDRLQERVALFDDALVIVTSDHGLHYGPNFPSWQGQKEATEPILYMSIPKEPNVNVDLDVLKSNARLWTTPYDLHETLLKLTKTTPKNERDAQKTRQGLLLTEPLPASRRKCETTSLIPLEYCERQSKKVEQHIQPPGGLCRGPNRPSIDSFFLDIFPLDRRPLMKFDAGCDDSKQNLTEISKFDLCQSWHS